MAGPTREVHYCDEDVCNGIANIVKNHFHSVSYPQAPVTTTLEPRWLQDRTLSMLRLTIEFELLVSKIISNFDLEISNIQMHK